MSGSTDNATQKEQLGDALRKRMAKLRAEYLLGQRLAEAYPTEADLNAGLSTPEAKAAIGGMTDAGLALMARAQKAMFSMGSMEEMAALQEEMTREMMVATAPLAALVGVSAEDFTLAVEAESK